MGSLVSSFGNIAGGVAAAPGLAQAEGDARNKAAISNQILQEISSAPDISKPLILEKYKQQGLLTPEMEQQISGGQSAMQGVNTDQQSLDAQKQALQQLQQRSTQGLTAADRAGLNQARQQAAQDQQSKQAQILQQAQMRGQGGQGSTLAAQLMAAQSGANNESAAADRLAQMAQQNALSATAQTGQLGGQINQQQFGQQSAKANAADQMNRFNVQNQVAQQQRNVGAANQAQAGNLANAQNISNANVGGQNAELNNQLSRQMQQYQANVNTAKIKSGGQADAGNTILAAGQRTAANLQNLGSGAGKAAGGAYDAYGKSGSSGGSMGGQDASASDMAEFGFSQGGRVDYTQGGHVGGQAKVPGDSPVNDIVRANLSPGEIVVPRSLAESKIGKEMLKLIHAHNSVKNKMNGND